MHFKLVALTICFLVGLCCIRIEPAPYVPYVSPKTCPKCGEKKTYEIVKVSGFDILGGPNRRCIKCNYTWFCEACRTRPFWEK